MHLYVLCHVLLWRVNAAEHVCRTELNLDDRRFFAEASRLLGCLLVFCWWPFRVVLLELWAVPRWWGVQGSSQSSRSHLTSSRRWECLVALLIWLHALYIMNKRSLPFEYSGEARAASSLGGCWAPEDLQPKDSVYALTSSRHTAVKGSAATDVGSSWFLLLLVRSCIVQNFWDVVTERVASFMWHIFGSYHRDWFERKGWFQRDIFGS